MEGHLRDGEILDASRFLIAARRLADDLSYGTDRSPFLGAGIEYVQSRHYLPGDSIRTIDWRVTARTGKLYVKEFEAPRRLPCYLLLDTSASMTVSSQPRSKYSIAVQLAGGIALACLDRASPVGVVAVGSRELRITPSLSRDRILQWLLELRRFRYDEPTQLGQRLIELSPLLTSRAMVIVLSDLHDPRGMTALKRLAQEHDCVVLQMSDPAERRLSKAGFVRGAEAESGRTFLASGRSAWLDQAAIDSELKRSAIDHLLIETDKPYAHRVRQFFASRHILGRGQR